MSLSVLIIMITLNELSVFCSDHKVFSQNPPVKTIDVLAGEVKEESIEKKPVVATAEYDDPEIMILAQHFGPLVDGLVLEVSLSDMLQILPRQRRKSDAYKGLSGRLKALGVQLRVASHYESKINGSEKRKNQN